MTVESYLSKKRDRCQTKPYRWPSSTVHTSLWLSHALSTVAALRQLRTSAISWLHVLAVSWLCSLLFRSHRLLQPMLGAVSSLRWPTSTTSSLTTCKTRSQRPSGPQVWLPRLIESTGLFRLGRSRSSLAITSIPIATGRVPLRRMRRSKQPSTLTSDETRTLSTSFEGVAPQVWSWGVQTLLQAQAALKNTPSRSEFSSKRIRENQVEQFEFGFEEKELCRHVNWDDHAG